MADNVAVTEGTGTAIGADEISSVKYQRVKLIHGADGVNAGDVATGNPLPVVQTGALPAGTAAIGKLAANSGVDIGDVDVTSLPASTNTLEVVGDVAEDAALAGNPVRIGVRASAAEPSAMSGDGDIVTPWGDRKGRQIVAFQAGTGAQTSVSSSASNVTILAANTSRKGATIYNDSTAILYIRFAATATTSNYTVQIAAGGYYEVPFGYTGIIDGIWASANGNARVTEIT